LGAVWRSSWATLPPHATYPVLAWAIQTPRAHWGPFLVAQRDPLIQSGIHTCAATQPTSSLPSCVACHSREARHRYIHQIGWGPQTWSPTAWHGGAEPSSRKGNVMPYAGRCMSSTTRTPAAAYNFMVLIRGGCTRAGRAGKVTPGSPGADIRSSCLFYSNTQLFCCFLGAKVLQSARAARRARAIHTNPTPECTARCGLCGSFRGTI